jgi:hypothetical protein
MVWGVVRTGDPAQVLGGLVLSYAVAGGLAYVFTPYANPIGAVASPLLGGVAAYAWLMGWGPQGEAFLRAAYAEALPGVAWVLPIHLASAGVTGACLGVAAAKGLEVARREEGLGGGEGAGR